MAKQRLLKQNHAKRGIPVLYYCRSLCIGSRTRRSFKISLRRLNLKWKSVLEFSYLVKFDDSIVDTENIIVTMLYNYIESSG